MKKVKKLLLWGIVLAAMTVILALGASAETYGDYEYTVVNADGTVQITGVENTAITEAVIPSEIDGKSVTSIGDWAFYSCSSLTSVRIPDGVTSIGDNAFSGCKMLESIYVFPANTAYSSSDGVLFNKNTTQLLQYPAGKTDTYF